MNRPFLSLDATCTSYVRVAISCRPSLYSQFFMTNTLSVLPKLKFCSMLLTSSLKLFSSAYLCLVLQSNVGCFMMGPLILGLTLSDLDVQAAVMVWIAVLVASATACPMNSFWLVCSLAIFFFVWLYFYNLFFKPSYMRLPLVVIYFLLTLPILSLPSVACFSLSLSDHLLLTPYSEFALYEDNTDMHLNAYLLLCSNEVLFIDSACVYIYICGAL